MGKHATNIWAVLKAIYRGQQIETASATLLGIGVSWHWLSSVLPDWIAIYFWPTVIALKAIVISTLSSLATNYVSYRFKKIVNGKETTPPRKGRKGSQSDKAA